MYVPRDFISIMNVFINVKLTVKNQNKAKQTKKFHIGVFLSKHSHNYLMYLLYFSLLFQYFQLFIQVIILIIHLY